MGWLAAGSKEARRADKRLAGGVNHRTLSIENLSPGGATDRQFEAQVTFVLSPLRG